MKLQTKDNALFSIYFSIFIFTVLFTGLRLFEIILHRSYLLKKPFMLSLQLSSSFFVDFLFFLTWSSFYILFYLFCEYYKIDRKNLLKSLFFHILHLPLLALFFLDMQTLAVQNKLFYWELLSALKIEMLINSWVFIIDYWHLALGFLVILYLFFKFLPVFDKNPMPQGRIVLAILINICFVILFLILLFQFKNLPFQKEYKYNGMLIRVAHFFHDFKECPTQFFSEEEVLNNLKKVRSEVSPRTTIRESENIILFIIEGFSLKYIQKNQMPFLTGLSNKGVFFKNHLTPELSTVLSTVSLLSGINSSLLDESGYSPKLKKALQKYLKRKIFFSSFKNAGYTTSFFFGDMKTTFGFETYIKNLDISHSFFREDYLKETNRTQDLDKEGNIYEKPFLNFSIKKIKKQKPPFFSIILTNQIHYPFFCSPDIKISHSIEKRIQICLKYIDDAIKGFFQKIQSEPWFKNTLFVFTSDTPNIPDFPNKHFDKKLKHLFLHNIPLVLYHPKKDLKKYQSNKVSSHVDIMPSLMSYLSIPHKISLTSNSIFQLKNKRRFFSRKTEIFYLIEDNYITMYICSDKNSKTYSINTGEWKEADQDIQEEYDNLIKSYIQYEYNIIDYWE